MFRRFEQFDEDNVRVEDELQDLLNAWLLRTALAWRVDTPRSSTRAKPHLCLAAPVEPTSGPAGLPKFGSTEAGSAMRIGASSAIPTACRHLWCFLRCAASARLRSRSAMAVAKLGPKLRHHRLRRRPIDNAEKRVTGTRQLVGVVDIVVQTSALFAPPRRLQDEVGHH